MDDSQPLKRLSYFFGQVLTAESFQLEQNYFREKFKRHNRTLHGFGIVSGLKVSVHSGEIIVEPGVALDCEGNELVLANRLMRDAATIPSEPCAVYVSIRYVEELTDELPLTREPSATLTDNVTEPSAIIEGVKIELTHENCNRAHRHLRARWLACGKAHGFTIAKLKRTPQGWSVERGYRPPMVK